MRSIVTYESEIWLPNLRARADVVRIEPAASLSERQRNRPNRNIRRRRSLRFVKSPRPSRVTRCSTERKYRDRTLSFFVILVSYLRKWFASIITWLAKIQYGEWLFFCEIAMNFDEFSSSKCAIDLDFGSTRLFDDVKWRDVYASISRATRRETTKHGRTRKTLSLQRKSLSYMWFIRLCFCLLTPIVSVMALRTDEYCDAHKRERIDSQRRHPHERASLHLAVATATQYRLSRAFSVCAAIHR